jgi:hypothetical protein
MRIPALFALIWAGGAAAQVPPAPVPQPAAARPAAIVVPKDTMVRLMVLNEVNTRKAKPGDRFVLRVDAPVTVDGITVIPVGAKAWGEVTRVVGNGAAGKAGAIAARLVEVEAGGGTIPLSGEDDSRGEKGTTRVAMAAMAFGPFGLLARGTQGKLKAGHIFEGYLAEERLFDPATGTLVAVAPAE